MVGHVSRKLCKYGKNELFRPVFIEDVVHGFPKLKGFVIRKPVEHIPVHTDTRTFCAHF